ncbi:MAG: DUF4347 domain-containing protein [Thermodesulfobacteriota bacterium]|nr:DUF4347 domain-containing protein [Thermodesulfobacteriota bacterium]
MKKPVLTAFFLSVALSFYAGSAGLSFAANSGHIQKGLAPFKEIVFIDTSLPDHQTLMAGVSSQVEVILLEATGHGIAQMARALEAREGLDAIHIISHGAPGQVFLGSTVLDTDSLDDYIASLTAWGNALSSIASATEGLTANGDILLYGCSVGQGYEGRELVRQMALTTGADVAASTNPTGNKDYGADWILEHTIGSVEADLPWTQTALETYSGTLSEFQWAKRAGGTATARGHGIAIDGSGNCLVTGRFQGTATFGAGEPNQTTLTSGDGSYDIFVAQYAAPELPNLVVTSITPDVTCTSDGNFSGTISVRVTNNGDIDTSGTFTVEVTDGKGWTGTGTYVLAIAADGFADVTINTGTWTPDCQPCAAPFSFNATVDLNNDISESNESDNTTGSATIYTVPSPDLAVDSNALAVVCADDNQVTITGTVTLTNNGCNTAVTSNIPMRFTLYDNTGCGGGVVEQWTDTFSSVNITAGGGTQAFAITNNTFTSNQCLDSSGCQVSIFLEADYNDSVCECDGTNNTYCADNIPVNIPDIEVNNDTLTVTCLDDGQVTVSGTVTLANNGCGSNLNSNVPMRFTLYDNTGCAGNQLSQWTQTFAGVNIASGGGTQVFAINPRTVTSDLVTNSTGCQVSIRVEADYNDSVCECDGTDNTYCADNKNIDIPDLQISSDTLAMTCLHDGQFTVSGTVTMLNNGCGSNLNSNIPARFTVYDNTGCAGSQVAQWTETLAGVNIPALGGTQVFAITPQDITADLVANSTGCQVSIFVEADYNDTICESDGTDNTLCSNKTVSIPDLRVNSVTPSVNCTADGTVSGTVTVNVENNGCGDVVGGAVQLTSSCGSISFVGQTVDLTAGSNSNLIFNYTPTSSTCTCDFIAVIDPGNLICESNNTNNSVTFSNYTPDIPDLEVTADTLSAGCSNDGEVIVTGGITVTNNGCGSFTSDIPVRFTLYDNTGCTGSVVSTWTETLTNIHINGGGATQVIAISAQSITTDLVVNSTNCQVSIFVEADYNHSVCEFDGTNNTYCADNKNISIPDLQVSSDTLEMTCQDPGQFRVSGTVTMVNNGCGSNLTTDIPVRFTIFDDIDCVGSEVAQWTETFSSVNIAAGGGTQVFTITQQVISSDLCSHATGGQVSIRIEADYTGTICESDGTDNALCSNKTVIIPWPAVTTHPVTETRSRSAMGNGEIEAIGTSNVTAHGMVWNLAGGPDPTTADNVTDVGEATEPLTFASTMTGLEPGTAYAVRAYATNDADTTYGEVLTFTTLPIPLPPVYYLLDEEEENPRRR